MTDMREYYIFNDYVIANSLLRTQTDTVKKPRGQLVWLQTEKYNKLNKTSVVIYIMLVVYP